MVYDYDDASRPETTTNRNGDVLFDRYELTCRIGRLDHGAFIDVRTQQSSVWQLPLQRRVQCGSCVG